MAAASTFSAGKFLLLIGDGGGSEVFAEPCAILTAEMTLSKETTDVVIPDCADPDAVGWTQRDATALSASISGEGLATATGVAALDAIAIATASRNMRFQLIGGGSGGGTPDRRYSGAFHLTSFTLGRQRGEKISFSFEAVSDGEVAVANVAALS